MDTLQNFENNDNPFFDSISYGLVCNIMVGRVNLEKNDIDDTFRGLITERKVKPKKKKKKRKAKYILRKNLYEKLIEVKDNIQLDKTSFGFFNKILAIQDTIIFSLNFWKEETSSGF